MNPESKKKQDEFIAQQMLAYGKFSEERLSEGETVDKALEQFVTKKEETKRQQVLILKSFAWFAIIILIICIVCSMYNSLYNISNDNYSYLCAIVGIIVNLSIIYKLEKEQHQQ